MINFFAYCPNRTNWLALLAVPLAVLASEGLGWWWMRPTDDADGVRLIGYNFPSSRYGCAERPIPKRIEEILDYDLGQTGTIQAGAGRMIDVNYFEWNRIDSTGLASASGHSPEVCMGKAGMKVEQFLPNRNHRLGDTDLVFDTTLFRDQSGGPIYIFKLAWAEGMDGINLLLEGPTRQDVRKYRIKAVVHRWRPRYARVLMLGVFGADNEEDAWKMARLNVLGDLQLVNRPHNPSPP